MAITKWDDYLIHQTADTIDTGVNSDPAFMDRLYIGCHNPEGTIHLAVGLGTYPNRNIMDGFVVIRHNDIQHNLMLSRHLNGDRSDMRIGPLSMEVMEPQKRWSVELGKNDSAMECSLEYEGSVAPFLCTKIEFSTPGGEFSNGHYFQQGKFKGNITLKGKQIEADGFIGARDRSWGVRPGSSATDLLGVHFWIQARFSDFSVALIAGELFEGTAILCDGCIQHNNGTVISITEMRHRVEFMPAARALAGLEMLVKGDDGKERVLTAKVISPAIYLNAAGYDRQGEDRGPLNIAVNKLDVSRPLGIDAPYFGINQSIAEFRFDERVGFGILETSFNKGKEYQYKPSW